MYEHIKKIRNEIPVSEFIVTNESAETVARFISHAKRMLQALEEYN